MMAERCLDIVVAFAILPHELRKRFYQKDKVYHARTSLQVYEARALATFVSA